MPLFDAPPSTTLTGDVTGTGTGSIAATIPAETVTLAKQANVVTGSVQGRLTAATGVPETLTKLQIAAILAGQTAALTAPICGAVLVFEGATVTNTTTALRYVGSLAALTVCPISLGWKFALLSMTASVSPGGVPPSGQNCTIKLFEDTVDKSAQHASLVIDNTHAIASAEMATPGTPYIIDASAALKSVEVKSLNSITAGAVSIAVTLIGYWIRP